MKPLIDELGELSLEQFRRRKFDTENDLKQIPVGTPAWLKGVARVHYAAEAFKKALEVSAVQFRAFSSAINVAIDFNQAYFIKLPRKKKKEYIRIHGRETYHRIYHKPSVILRIDSPGGYTFD